MARIHFDDKIITCTGESVLTALLARGYTIPHSCQSGVCQSCLMVCEQGQLPAAATAGLSPAAQQQGLFLSCQCQPTGDIRVRLYNPRETAQLATVVGKQWLDGQVLRLTLRAGLSFRAGQTLTLWRDEQTARCYSITHPPRDDQTLELHIRVLPGGAFSQWAAGSLTVGDTLPVQGPLGDFYYQPLGDDQPLLLVGVGTGLAPLHGILLDAIARGHRGPLHLLVGGRDRASFYFLPPLAALERQYPQLRIHRLTLEEGVEPPLQTADIYQFVRQHYRELRPWQIYIAGARHFVQKMRKICFMAGASGRQILTDQF